MRILPGVSYPIFIGASMLAAWHVGVAVAQTDALSDWRTERKGRLTVYTPTDLKTGELFTLIQEPPVNAAGKDLSGLLTSQIDKDGPILGTIINRAKPTLSTKNGLEIATCAVVYRPKSAQGSLLASYTVVRRSDGEARLSRILSSTNKETYSRYLPVATKAMLTFGGGSSSSGGTSQVASNSGSTGKSKPRRPRSEDRYTRPGAGPKASQVFGIYSKMLMRGGVGGSFYQVHVPMIVLKDGTYYEDFDVPLADFDVAAARAARPSAWGKWRKQGSTIQIQNSKGVWEKGDFYGPLPAAKPGEKLTGLYSTISGGGDTAFGGTTVIVSTSDLTFLPDGRFKAGRFGGGMTPNVTATSKSETDGTYTLDGYTLTLKFRDGHGERKAFAFMDNDGTKDAFHLNGSPYLKKDGKD